MTLVIHGVSFGDLEVERRADLTIVDLHRAKSLVSRFVFVAQAEQGSEIAGTSLYKNNGNGTFTDVTGAAGVSVDGICWAGIWSDLR